MEIFGLISLLIVLGSSIWVLFDAKALGARKIPGAGALSMWPYEWFTACLLLWIVAFPIYLSQRDVIRKNAGP